MKIGNTNNIKVLAPTLVEKYTEEEIDESIYKEYNKNTMGIANKYFFGHLHEQ